MLMFQCYSSYCHQQVRKKYELSPMDDINEHPPQTTLSFRSVFQQEITHAV